SRRIRRNAGVLLRFTGDPERSRKRHDWRNYALLYVLSRNQSEDGGQDRLRSGEGLGGLILRKANIMAHGDVHHDYHLVDPSPWPIVGASGAGLMLIGAVFWMNSGYTG